MHGIDVLGVKRNAGRGERGREARVNGAEPADRGEQAQGAAAKVS